MSKNLDDLGLPPILLETATLPSGSVKIAIENGHL